MDKIQELNQFKNLLLDLEKSINNIITTDFIKICDNEVLDFKKFYFLMQSKYIKHYEKISEGFVGDHFIYTLNVYLEDGSIVKVNVERDNLAHTFLSENSLVVDTVECMHMLNDMFDSGYFVTKLHINEPKFLDKDNKNFSKRELHFIGIKNSGIDEIECSSITEIEQDVIACIP